MPRVKDHRSKEEKASNKKTIVTAKFNGKGSSKKNFPKINETKDLVLLSIVGNEYCAGEYLGATVKQAIKSHRFTTFLIADEVYWHNLRKTVAKPSAEEEATLKEEALKLGAQYFEDNLEQFLAPFGISVMQFNANYPNKSAAEKIRIINDMAKDASLPFEIVGWKDWTDFPAYNEKKVAITALYELEATLKHSIDKTAEEFAQRHNKVDGNLELWRARSKGYLTEESPTVMWIAAAKGINFVVYPGDMLDTFQKTKDYFIVKNDEPINNILKIPVEDPKLLVNWLDVYFDRYIADNSPAINPGMYSFFSPDSSKAQLVFSIQAKGKAIIDTEVTRIASEKLVNVGEALVATQAKAKVVEVINHIAPELLSLSLEQREQVLKVLTEISNSFGKIEVGVIQVAQVEEIEGSTSSPCMN